LSDDDLEDALETGLKAETEKREAMKKRLEYILVNWNYQLRKIMKRLYQEIFFFKMPPDCKFEEKSWKTSTSTQKLNWIGRLD
jgi:hypothetical protein